MASSEAEKRKEDTSTLSVGRLNGFEFDRRDLSRSSRSLLASSQLDQHRAI